MRCKECRFLLSEILTPSFTKSWKPASPFLCVYSFSHRLFSWLTVFPVRRLSSECSVSAIADLVFLVDGSWSVGRENFKHIRSFISSLAGAFDIGEDKTRVAVVQYSSDTRTEFPLTRYTRRGDLLQAINSLPYKGGNTMTGTMFIGMLWISFFNLIASEDLKIHVNFFLKVMP